MTDGSKKDSTADWRQYYVGVVMQSREHIQSRHLQVTCFFELVTLPSDFDMPCLFRFLDSRIITLALGFCPHVRSDLAVKFGVQTL